MSYRRRDSQEICENLYHHLTKNLPDLKIFMDTKGIEPGKEWRYALEAGVNNCDVFIAIIGQEWLSIKNEKGDRRITERTDYVRQEISSAIRNHKYIIPVLVNGASVPEFNELPHSIKDITRHQAFRLSDNIEEDAKALANWITKAIKEKKSNDRERVTSKIFNGVGIVLLFPFFIVYRILSRLANFISSNFLLFLFSLLTIALCFTCSWLVYEIYSSMFPQ